MEINFIDVIFACVNILKKQIQYINVIIVRRKLIKVVTVVN